MRMTLLLDGRAEAGGSPLVMHNERLADPLDEYVRDIAKLSRKRQKTEADHLEIARLEFLGGLYLNGDGVPSVAAVALLDDYDLVPLGLQCRANTLPAPAAVPRTMDENE